MKRQQILPTLVRLPNHQPAFQKLARQPDYPALFQAAFSAPGITADRAVKAIAQFERTLLSTRSRFDRVMAGEERFSEEEQRGFELFQSEKADCFHCHVPPLFTDLRFHNNGLDTVPDDPGIARCGLDGVGLFELPDDSPALAAVREMTRQAAPTLGAAHV